MNDGSLISPPRPLPPTSPAFGLEQSALLEAYWRELRGARQLPARTSVDPARIDAVLPHSFIIERVAPGIARLRVSGQAINRYVGAEARGMPLSVLFSVQGRDVLARWIDKVFDLPAVVELPLQSTRSFARPKLTGKLLILPLESADGSVNRALGAILTEGMTNNSPRVFDIPEDREPRCDPVGYDGAETPRPAPFQRPALRLVVNNS